MTTVLGTRYSNVLFLMLQFGTPVLAAGLRSMIPTYEFSFVSQLIQ